MATIIEWQLPYTAWDGIEITARKVIKVLLREGNNLIKLNSENELYTDLQLESWITPESDFPVWITVWQVLQEDWWLVNGTLLNFLTTSWDYGRWLYWADGHMYYDAGTWEFTQIYSSEEVDDLFTQLRSELATVAFTWDYNDLLNRPEIVNPYDWELTLTKNWVEIGTFTANQQQDETINIEVPTKTSDIVNDSWFIDNTVNDLVNYTKTSDLAPVALSNDYDDLNDKPTIWNATLTIQKNWTNVNTFTANATTDKTINITMDKTDVWLWNVDNTSDLDKPISTATQAALDLKANSADLATVATTGSYTDLTNKPTIWDATITIQKNWTAVDTFTTNATANKNINIALTKSDVWLSNVDNTSDLNKPISTAVQTALNLKANSADLATVATSGSYTDLSNTPNLATVATSWSYNDLSNKPTIPTVINNVTSTDTANALSAAQGKVLQDQINDLKALGKFLSLWDCSTWLPISFPEAIPYTYSTWDYFLVETVWGNNKRPAWASYTWAASTTAETDEVEVWDMYIYDGQVWLLQINHWKTVSFANLSWQPTDNSALSTALNWKQATLVSWTNIKTVNNTTLLWSGNVAVQPTLVSWTNIKTINNTSLLGSWNIAVQATISDLSTIRSWAAAWATAVQPWDLATVATSWSYNDLADKPTIPAWQVQANWTQTTTTAVDYIKNKPSLATVATSGSYNDLSNKPTIPAAQVQTDWNASSWMASIKNKPTLATVATSWAYSDLSWTPSLATVATSWSYNDLSNKPTIPTKTSQLTNDNWFVTNQVSDTAYASSWNWVTTTAPSKNAVYDKISAMDTTISGKADSSSLAAVATSWSYNDLSNKPTIPTVNNTTITFTQNWVSKWDITLNQSTAETIALTDTTYTRGTATSWGTTLSLVNTGDMYTWNNKQNAISNITKSEIQTWTATTQRTITASVIKSALPTLSSESNNLWYVKMWCGTKANYDAMSSHDANTLYFCTE